MLNFYKKIIKTDVCFVCTSSIDEIWIRSTVFECLSMGLGVSIVVCDKAKNSHVALEKIYKNSEAKLFFGITLREAARFKSQVIVTASSGLTKNIFPTKCKKFVHMPHSFASLHLIYPDGAFNGYDYLFAVGPHHVREFNQISTKHGLVNGGSFEIGYGKLDYFRSARSELTSKKHVLIAPSWGDGNLLNTLGEELVRALINDGWQVTVRPHPIFFLENTPIIQHMSNLANKHDRLNLESPLDGDCAIHDASVMIGDYSGTSFEFAVYRRRPVISVNVPRKIGNPKWREYDMEPIEIHCRSMLGPVVEPRVDLIVDAINREQKSVSDIDISKFLFDAGDTCAYRAASTIKKLIDDN